MRALFPATNHIGNDYLPWKSLFASMKFIDGLDSKYTLKNEDISKTDTNASHSEKLEKYFSFKK